MFRMFKLASLVLIALGAGAVAAASQGAGELPIVDIAYERHVLPNGLTLILHEDHKTPIVGLNVWYHVGSKDEKTGKTGFAHLFEHLMFQGSKNHNDEFFRPLEKAGATGFNGTTDNDRTNYFENVPTPALDLALWLESDRMAHTIEVVDKKRLDEQRGVVQNEKRQSENQPYGKVWEQIAQSTYPVGHPYSWSVIGSMDDLSAAALDDVHEWFKRYYGPSNAVLVVSGDINPVEVKKKVEHYFGGIAPGPLLKKHQSWPAKMQGIKRARQEDRVPQARIYKVWNTPGFTDQRLDTQLDLAAAVLGQGKNSRLYKRLVYQDRIATDASAYLSSGEIGSQMVMVATAKPGADLKAVETALDEELARFLREGPTDEELERLKTTRFAAQIRGVERIGGFGGKSDVLAYHEVYFDNPGQYRDGLRELRDAKKADVQQAARDWLSDGQFVLEVHPFANYQASTSSVVRNKMPAVGEAAALDLPEFQRATLDNGLKLVLVERHAAPVVQINLLARGGLAADDPKLPGLASFTQAMLMEGTAKRDSLAIAARAEDLGAQLGAGAGLDHFTVSLSALTARLDDSLELYSDVLLNPAFPDAEVERLRALRLAGIAREKVTPGGLQSRNLARLAYGEAHPYAIARGGSGTEAAVGAMTASDMRALYAAHLRPDNATLIVVGDTTMAQLKPLLEKHLGGWRAPQAPLAVKPLPTVTARAKPRVYLINRTGAEQSQIVAATLAPPRNDPGYIPMAMANDILGGTFISRLNLNLREDKHWAYGAHSFLPDALGQRLHTAFAAVQTDKTAESMNEILKELRGVVQGKPFTAAEISMARENLVLKLPGAHESSAQVAGSVNTITAFGLPDDYFDTFVGEVRTQSPANLAAAAKRLVNPDAVTWLVIGDLSKIEAGIRKLNVGEVTVLDADGKPLR